MQPWEVVLATGDARLSFYVRRFDNLELHLVMWAIAFTQEPEEDMFGTDVVRAQGSVGDGEFQRPGRPRIERMLRPYLAGGTAGNERTDRVFDRGGRDAEFAEDSSGETVGFVEQAEQEVLGASITVPTACGPGGGSDPVSGCSGLAPEAAVGDEVSAL